MKKFIEYRTTTNSSVYRKLHKEAHAHCSFCKWNCGCNNTGKWYSFGGREPNWKLSSKNAKQWNKRTLRIDYKHDGYSW